jgi:hypothetical protein
VGSLPSPKFGNKLNAETEILVQSFYEDNEYSRMLPGAKDYFQKCGEAKTTSFL